MPQTYGVPLGEIERGIKNGVRKVNIDTDCRLAMEKLEKFVRLKSLNLI